MRVVISTGRSINVAEGDNDVDDAASLLRRLFLFEVDEAPLFFRLVDLFLDLERAMLALVYVS